MNMFSLTVMVTLAAWAIMACSYAGWGRAAFGWLRLPVSERTNPFMLVWIGWAVCMVLLSLCQMVVPVSVAMALAVFGCGTVLAVPLIRPAQENLRRLPVLFWTVLAILVFVLAAWLASMGMLVPAIYDSGLYHFNIIRWLNEYPIVPGLGNLHSRLAFNQSFFVYVAALNRFPLFGHGHNLANGFLFLILTVECLFCLLVCIVQWRKRQGGADYRHLVPALFLPALAYTAIHASLASPSPDSASCVLQILLFITAVRSLDLETDVHERTRCTVFLWVLAATAVTVKLSSLVYVVAIAAAVLVVPRPGRPREESRAWRTPYVVAAGACGFVFLVWMGRGVILSGYPLYPSRMGGLSTDWVMPVSLVDNEARWIYSWARMPFANPEEVLGNWGWFPPWLAAALGMHVRVVYPCALSLLAVAVFAVVLCRSPAAVARRCGVVAARLVLPVLAGLLFWFLTAPDVRFAHSLFWILPVAAGVPLLMPRVPLRVGAAAFLLVNAGLGFWFVSHRNEWRHWPAVHYEPLPLAKLTTKQTDSGLRVWVPVEDARVWDSPLPATPYFNARLRCRGADIGAGFTLRPP